MGLEDVYRICSEEAQLVSLRHVIHEIVWMAMCHINDDLVSDSLREAGLDVSQFRREVSDIAQQKGRMMKPVQGSDVKISRECFHLFREARRNTENLGRVWPSPIDLLIEMAERTNESVSVLLRDAGSSPHRIARTALDIRTERTAALSRDVVPTTSQKPPFEQLARDYTEMARRGVLTPVIGRRDEILQVLQVLARKQKNNPVLVGEAWVGKTAIVEGLALRSIEDDCSPYLRGKRILELSMTTLVAGTRYPGDLEERLQAVLRQAETDRDIILFIDELHTLMGAGRAEGAVLDAANFIKPVRARGRLRLIGATTLDEYHKHIESDPALERRFQPVLVEEPTPDETVVILQGLRSGYEDHHQVTISDEAIKVAVELTVRYVPERRLPDKARDVIDQAAAQMRIQTVGPGHEHDKRRLTVGRQQIAATISNWKGIPTEQVGQEDRERLRRLNDRLCERVKGQGGIVDAVAEAVQVAMLGLTDPNRPNGVFLFCGPSGVGKTELARALAEQLFGDEGALIRFDMSEYMEEHCISGLIGAPPGLVGYEDGGRLTDAVRARPFCVLLLHEIEKAHPKVLHLFLQAFGEGRLTDTRGRTADFRNAIIIMTSNLGAKAGLDSEVGGFGFQPLHEEKDHLQEAIQEAIGKEFPPEFIGCLSAVHVFRPLSRETSRRIIDKFLQRLEKQLASYGVKIRMDDGVYDLLLDVGFSRELGARPLEQAMDHLIRAQLARALLDGPADSSGRVLTVQRAGDNVQLHWETIATTEGGARSTE